jgi:hypothetical protein
MDPPTGAAAAQAARDEELRGECANAFEHYKKGNLTLGTNLLQKLLARHPAHPLLHYALVRLAHMLFLEQRQLEGIMTHFKECWNRVEAARKACPGSLLHYLLDAQAFCDCPMTNDQALDAVRAAAPSSAATRLNTTDLQYAKAIATFDEDVFGLAMFPDVRECANPAAYRSQAVANLTKAPAMITDLHRQVENLGRSHPEQSGLDHFIDLRDAMHATVAARRLQFVQARAGEEEADLALASVHQVMAGKGAAHDLQVAAAGWRESADQGDASAQLLIGALLARGGGGVRRSLPLGKRYLELSAAAGNETAVTLLKKLRKCVGCGELDVHHMICSQCRDARYCDDDCQLRHWQCLIDPHKPHCVPRREAAGAGGSLDRVEPLAHLDLLEDQIAAAAAARVAGNDMFREQNYPEVWPGFNMCAVSLVKGRLPHIARGVLRGDVTILTWMIPGLTPRRLSSTPSPSSSTPTTPK